MNFPPLQFLIVTAWVAALLTGLALLLTQLARAPRWVGDLFARAPALDVIVAAFTWVPWVAGAAEAGWAGFFGALAGQVGAYFTWVLLHEASHPQAVRGPRIVKVINRTVGRWRNHAALWVTMIALPCFWHFRFIEVFVYPLLVWGLKFPRYRHGDWVSVSRHKFEGLVGHDLFWCLYCDWMTGVWALGSEMLRNVESFWCPIRFDSEKKCANCAIDFPDVNHGWVPAGRTMAEVAQTVEAMYSDGRRGWFGHPARITVRGKDLPGRDGNGNGSGAAAPVALEAVTGRE